MIILECVEQQYLKYWRSVDTVDIFTYFVSGGDGEEGRECCRQDDGECLQVMFGHLII